MACKRQILFSCLGLDLHFTEAIIFHRFSNRLLACTLLTQQ
jgi:hypothetical protein